MKVSFLTLPLILARGLLSISVSMYAPPGTFVSYDSEHPVTMKATIPEFHFTNPRMQLYFDIAADKGSVTHWSLEGPAPAVWVQAGWGRKRTEAALAPETEITITWSPARNGKPGGKAFRAFAPPSQMLFGSDFPAEEPAETLYQLQQRDLPPDVAHALYRGLFPRLKAS